MFGRLILGEKLRAIQWVSTFSAMFGVLLLTNPGWILFWRDDVETGYKLSDYPYFTFGVINALGCSMFSGLAYIYMRQLGTAVDPTASNFHFGLISIALSVPCMLLFDTP